MPRLQLTAAACLAALLAGCAAPQMALKSTRTGGDSAPLVRADMAGKADLSSLNVGDTVAVSPGNSKIVVASSPLVYTLYEDSTVTHAEIKRQLTVNRKDAPRIEFLKGELHRGDFVRREILLDLHSKDPNEFNRTIHFLAFNRGEKAFRGDLTVYDLLPAELELVRLGPANKYTDQTMVKGVLSGLPFLSLVTLAMDNYSRSDEQVPMRHERLDQVQKYTFQRVVLEPGQAIGFTMNVRYQLPSEQELADLRENAAPLVQPGHH
ncbi:hypothetical protein [Cupriavidus consociatus]|uniref:hypothetical protein n=1 Tax=Cupriavidus consociatus TaxID=2821357 RepID=UPI001AE1BEB5|nr:MULTISPECIES: hypothetical protein [unclassified Cupriavidus]MBP0619826.1 hypothetical protein [Cupriavidus sp. LEh25]MDK2656478.1 hypothetical protein [Cupriavidus sp. LEh21]